MGVILGLAAALLYGGSDFAGGLASRKLGALPVNVVCSPDPPDPASARRRARRHRRVVKLSRS
jgi:hypothetical protein